MLMVCVTDIDINSKNYINANTQCEQQSKIFRRVSELQGSIAKNPSQELGPVGKFQYGMPI